MTKRLNFAPYVLCFFAFLLYSCHEEHTPGIVIIPAAEPKTFTVDSISFTMVGVEGGTFTMGATQEIPNPYDDETPAHKVTLSTFMISETEVTQALWDAVMAYNPSSFLHPELPVDNVAWEECQDFIDKLNKLTRQHFRLPTEAEWEYACRGGQKSRHAPFSGSRTLDEVGWYRGNCKEPQPVHQLMPNELGLYDMSGNVWEWCNDYYAPYPEDSIVNPKGPAEGNYHVCRGGCWSGGTRGCSPTIRSRLKPGGRRNVVGFRLAM